MTIPTEKSSTLLSAAGVAQLNTATVTQYLSSQSKLGRALRGEGDRHAVLLRSAPRWDGPVEPAWGDGLRARVAAAPSPLAVHELVLAHLDTQATGPRVLVVMTDREHTELDPGILARTHKRRIEVVDSWDVVREAFGAAQIDPRLKDAKWAAEALLEATPPGGWPKLPGGMLSRRAALTSLALRRLRLGRYDNDRDLSQGPVDDRLDAHTLLLWSLLSGGPERLLALRGPERDGLSAFLGDDDQAGLAGRALVALVKADHGSEAVAFGLVCAALWTHAAADADVYRARGRAERWLGEKPPAVGEQLDTLVAAFGRACEEYVAAQLAAGRSSAEDAETVREARRITDTVLDRAAMLTRQFGAEKAAAASPLLTAGLEARFTAVGRALASADPDVVTSAVKAFEEHQLSREPQVGARIERTQMARRLVRWLDTGPAEHSATVAAAIERHIAETGWVDRALEHIEAGGDPDTVLKAAYDRLGVQIRARRHEIDRAFARQLAVWTAAGTDPGTMLTVETFLRSVIVPVVKARGERVLLLVIDGMSAAIACELAEELRNTWAEYDPVPVKIAAGLPRRRAMAAALPTLTRVSRTSLFAGALIDGGQSDEKRLFPTHRFWAGAPAAVFHKDDLRAPSSGATFGPELLDALGDERAHIAVVLNAVDDRLAKEQKLGDGAWRVNDIPGLGELLREAAVHGMAVVITSDHGHVVDRRGAKLEAAQPDSARHRRPGGDLAEPEVALSGPRVVWPEPGAAIVALWDRDHRYTALKAGYHGGASLAEFTIPVLAFLPFGAEPPAHWRELGDQRPAWWSTAAQPKLRAPEPSAPPVKKPTRSGKTQTRRAQEQAAEHSALFDIELTDATDAPGREALLVVQPAPPRKDLATLLMASPIFADQLELLARKPSKAQVEEAVRVLHQAGGTLPATALAQRIGLRASGASGFAAVLRQLLNFDGVQVLETLPDGRTLRLDRLLLEEQFELTRDTK